MTKDQQFAASVQHFENMHPEELELLCIHLMPDLQFRFATFEGTDYHDGNVTCYLYRNVPDSVFFSVEDPFEIETALDRLILLNPGVIWNWATLNYIDHDKSERPHVTVELCLSSIPMRISSSGQLICK